MVSGSGSAAVCGSYAVRRIGGLADERAALRRVCGVKAAGVFCA